MNDLINPVVEIKRLDTELGELKKQLSDEIGRTIQGQMSLLNYNSAEVMNRTIDVEHNMQRLRFDLDELKESIKENKSDKALSSGIKRLDNEIKIIREENQNLNILFEKEAENIWQSIIALEKFMNEERLKPVFDKFKELESEFKKKALEIVTGSLSNE